MRILVLLYCFIIAAASFAQTTKLDRDAYMLAHSSEDKMINALVKGDTEKIRAIVNAASGIFRYASGDIASVSISPAGLKALASDPSVIRIEARAGNRQVLNDTMLSNNNVNPVHAGMTPLPQGYNGTGVVVGIIDTGIDFTHPDFKDSNGNTRIKHLWDQTQPAAANTPQPYAYGQEWDSAAIDSGSPTHTDLTYWGHGTHVSGIAAGNGLAINKYKGVAPNADIIMVALDFGNPNGVADATEYIYSKAQAMGKPCVINASVGDYLGSHDGLNLEAQLINNLITAQNGRAFVAAAGNAGNYPYHLGYTVTSDTSFTWFNAGSTISFQMWADTSDLQNVDFAIGVDMIAPTYSFRGSTPFTDISQHIGIFASDTIYNNGNRIGIVYTYGELVGGVYSMIFTIAPDSTQYKWRLMTTGSGKFDVWSFDMIYSGLPSASVFPPIVNYKLPDVSKTIVSSFQCLDNVITVGSYVNRDRHYDYNNVLQIDTNQVPQTLAVNSSRGPTRDGRQKPDITASGAYTISCTVLSMVPSFIQYSPHQLDLGAYHMTGGGTSAASPIVAGAAALYLQANPNATAAQVRTAITSCTKQDQYTGTNLPNYLWGYGKLNAFQALTGCTTGMEEETPASTLTIHPNPFSTDAVIQFSAPLNEAFEVLVHNTLGELVRIIKVSTGTNTLNIDRAGLDAGIYFCTVAVNGQKLATKKMIVL